MKRSLYSRPAKPMFAAVPVRDWRERTIPKDGPQPPLAIHAGTECHVTPPSVAARMSDYAGHLWGCDILEPSAGTGNLARAIVEAGGDMERLTLVEMHSTLANALRGQWRVTQGDFLELAQEWAGQRAFDRIVMNPPFGRVKAHIGAAVRLLRPGGCLVALVPITFERAGMEHLEELPVDTFASARVHTKLVRIYC